MTKRLTADEARERVTELEAELAKIRAVALDGGHIRWTTVEYPNAEVDLDVTGNLVEVRLTSGVETFSVVQP